MRLALWVILAGCGAPEAVDPAPVEAQGSEALPVVEAEAVGDWTPDDQQRAAIKLLSQRDPEPRCADVAALVEDPLQTWRLVVEHVEMPPWTPMRAATCLISEHPREAEEDALRWVADEDKAGLTRLVLTRLDALPLDVAERIARRALAGPHQDLARGRLQRARRPELRALAEGP